MKYNKELMTKVKESMLNNYKKLKDISKDDYNIGVLNAYCKHDLNKKQFFQFTESYDNLEDHESVLTYRCTECHTEQEYTEEIEDEAIDILRDFRCAKCGSDDVTKIYYRTIRMHDDGVFGTDLVCAACCSLCDHQTEVSNMEEGTANLTNVGFYVYNEDGEKIEI